MILCGSAVEPLTLRSNRRILRLSGLCHFHVLFTFVKEPSLVANVLPSSENTIKLSLQPRKIALFSGNIGYTGLRI